MESLCLILVERCFWSGGLDVTEAALQTHHNCGCDGLLQRGRAIVDNGKTKRLGRRSPSYKLFTSARANRHLFSENYAARAANAWGLSTRHSILIIIPPLPSAVVGPTCDFCFRFFSFFFFEMGRQTVNACVRELFTCALRLSPLKHGLYGSGWCVRILKKKPPGERRVCCVYGLLGKPPTSKARSHTGFEPPRWSGCTAMTRTDGESWVRAGARMTR